MLDEGPLAYGSIPADYLFQLHFEAQQPYRYELWWLERDSPKPGSLESGPTRRTLVFKGP